jgi:hypothetical protein
LVVIVVFTAACAGAAKISELETATSAATMAPAARRPLSDRPPDLPARSTVDVVNVVWMSMKFVALTRWTIFDTTPGFTFPGRGS